MMRKLKQWWWTWKMKRATQREQVLQGRLRAALEDARIERRHKEITQQMLAEVQGDFAELQARYADLQYARCQDARLGRFQPEAEAA